MALAGCGADPGAGPEPDRFDRSDLDALFAPPTSAEVAAVRADWAGRDVAAHDVRVELRDTVAIGIDTVEVRILSHRVAGEGHYGAVVVPLRGAPVPALVYAHFGAYGVNVESTLLALGAVAGLRAGRVALVVPAYRGKALSYRGREWVSTGRVSLWDGEVDDALALLHVAWAQPGVARGGTAAIGFSAGAAVALLAAAREPDIAAVVDYFAPVDFFSAWSRALFERILDGDAPPIDSIAQLEADLVGPLQAGRYDVPAFRRELLKRSALHFADGLPPVLAHHGTADDVVAVEQTRDLEARVRQLGGSLQAHYYEGRGHNPFELYGSLARTADFLAAAGAAPVARAGRLAPTADVLAAVGAAPVARAGRPAPTADVLAAVGAAPPAAQAGRPPPSRSSWAAPGSGIASQRAKGWSPPMQ